MESTDLIGRPEPTIDQFWEELRFVTAVEIAPWKKKLFDFCTPEKSSRFQRACQLNFKNDIIL